MDVTAVVLSAKPVSLVLPGLTVLAHVSTFDTPAGLLKARYDAIRRVETKHFFFLDDDDALPEDHLAVIQKCVDANAAVAYTNEVIHTQGAKVLCRSEPYDAERHIQMNVLIHHLALCETSAARAVLEEVPEGNFGFEPLFYFQLAKRGAAWVDEVGYIWQRALTGLSRDPRMHEAMLRSSIWAHRSQQ